MTNFVAIFLGILLWIPLGSLFFPIYFVFYIISKFVHLIAKWFRPDLIPISKVDSFLTTGPSDTESSFVYTSQVWKVKGKIGVSQFRTHFQQCFLSTEEDRNKYVNFYCYFVTFCGFVYKKRVDSIDLNFHIGELNLEEGSSVEDFLGKWMVTHVVDEQAEIHRPSWQVKIIPQGNQTTVLFKLHHGICDGYTMVHLVGKLSGTHAPYLFKEKEPKALDLLISLLQFPHSLIEQWTSMYLSSFTSMVNLCTGWKPKDEENWLISFCSLDLSTVKEIRRQTNTNFACVMMSVQIGALKRLMEDFSENANKMEDTYLGHSMGWPNHPAMTTGEGMTGMTNHLTLNVITASFKLDDPLERLLGIDKNFKERKSNGYPNLAYYMLFNMFKHQPSWFSRLLINANLSVIGMESALSTLLCSPNSYTLLGCPVENLYLPVLLPSLFPRMKMMTVPVSHSGILDTSINASTALVKNQQGLDRLAHIYFPEELKALKSRCQALFK